MRKTLGIDPEFIRWIIEISSRGSHFDRSKLGDRVGVSTSSRLQFLPLRIVVMIVLMPGDRREKPLEAYLRMPCTGKMKVYFSKRLSDAARFRKIAL